MINDEDTEVIKETKIKQSKASFILIHVMSSIVLIIIALLFISLITSKKGEYREKGIKAYQVGDYEEAIRYFDKSLNEKQLFSKKMDLDTRMYLGSADIKTGRYKDAIFNFNKLKENNDGSINSNKIEEYLQLSIAMDGYDSRDAELNIPALEKSLKEGNMSVRLLLAGSYYKAGYYDEMLSIYNDYIKDEGLSYYVAYQLSSYYIEAGDYETANKYIEDGLKIKDDDNVMKSRLLYNKVVYYESFKDYEKALSLMTSIYESEPNNKEFEKEYNYLFTRINMDPEPVIKEDVD